MTANGMKSEKENELQRKEEESVASSLNDVRESHEMRLIPVFCELLPVFSSTLHFRSS